MFKKVCRIGQQWCSAIYDACFNKPVGYVWMFHRVAPHDGALPVIDELRVSPEYFRQFLVDKKKLGKFVDMQQFMNVMNGKQKLRKPFHLITFDDGYEDNYTYAYPILKELEIPFVIYVSVDLVSDHQPIWNYPLIIERVVRNNDELLLGNGQRYICISEAEKNSTFLQLKALLFSLPYKQLREQFTTLFADYLTDEVFPTNTMNWEQIRELANDPLCTIGSHTMSHCRLAMSDMNDLIYELQMSRQILSEQIGKLVDHMSYPYGWITDVSKEAVEVVKQVGYKTAFHSFGGAIRKKDKDMFHLKRIMVNEQ